MIAEEMTEIDGAPIGYARYGTGPNNFLFIPGGVGCYAKDYPPAVPMAFDSAKVTIIMIDPPGYGKSRPPDRKQAVNRCQLDAQVCIKLMQKLGLTPFTVVGWSEGGRTAVHVANQGRDAVKKMVMFGASTRCDARGARVFQSMRNTDLWLAETKAVYLEHYDEDYFRKQWADLCDLVVQVYDDLGGRFLSDHCLKRIRQPVLVLNGGMDRFCSDPKYFLENFPDARLIVHAQANHDLHIKYPQWFAEHVQDFAIDD
uniref:AB hydrolase-1 domain-containing protein n=1 Tax=Plectus sambesii TaxID=2011161 RepID=A0A914V1W8_9BILA